MSILDVAVSAIGEAAVYVVGWVAGKTFHLEPERAQRIGEYIVLGAIVGAAVLVTFLYS